MKKNDIYCALYASSKVEIPLESGKVKIVQVSRYPYDENVQIVLSPEFDKQSFALKLRIPTRTGYQFLTGQLYSYVVAIPENSKNWSVSINGKNQKVIVENGFVTIHRNWSKGDVVRLHLSMPVRFNKSIERVFANRRRIAITRGPIVYCAESIDNCAPANVWCVLEVEQNPKVEKQTTGVLNGIDVIKDIKANYIDKDKCCSSSKFCGRHFASKTYRIKIDILRAIFSL